MSRFIQSTRRKTGWLKDNLIGLARYCRSQFRVPSSNAKVICIGFNKTGTTSLGGALAMLGYRHTSFNHIVWHQYCRGQLERVVDFVSRFESADDLPWLKEDMIPVLDKSFPGTKFIYLFREERAWRRSIERWTKWVTGEDLDVDAEWAKYQNHHRFVLDYFADRPEDLLVLAIDDPDGFLKLAEFLGKSAPSREFPHLNATPDA